MNLIRGWVVHRIKIAIIGAGVSGLPAAQVVWFILIMGLGNIATAAYVLLQLARMKPGDSWESLLLRRTATSGVGSSG